MDGEKNRQETLPKMLAGTVHAQMVRCGRHGCRCEQGTLHGPYYYRFWREDGQLRRAYVKACEVAEVRAACAAARMQGKQERQERQEAERQGREEFRRITSLLREIEK